MMQTVEFMAMPQNGFQPFQVQQLVLVHLPDVSRNYALVPVPGVVVRPGANETAVRVRNLTGHLVTISISNNDLAAR